MTKEREIGMLQNNPEKDPLTEKLIDSGIAYKGSFLQVHKDTVKTPDGVVTTREYLHHPGASMIIPMFEDGTVILERQYRHPLRRSFLEFPAGKLNPGESPFNCANSRKKRVTKPRSGKNSAASIMRSDIPMRRSLSFTPEIYSMSDKI